MNSGEGEIRFARAAGKSAMFLAVLSAFLILIQPLVGSIPACRRPEWLENGLRFLALTAVILTVVVAWVSILLGIVLPKAHAATRGFASLSVVAIAFIALIMFVSARATENFNGESAAIATLRTINTAEITYSSAHDGSWGTLEDLTDAMLLDSRFGYQLPVQGYRYNVSFSPHGYIATATRDAANCAARWDLFSKEDAIIKYSADVRRAPSGKAGTPVD
jgi:hypothetical protein